MNFEDSRQALKRLFENEIIERTTIEVAGDYCYWYVLALEEPSSNIKLLDVEVQTQTDLMGHTIKSSCAVFGHKHIE